MHVEWELTKDQWTQIDLEDWSKIEQYNWLARYDSKLKSFYAVANTKISGKRVFLYMHRFILGLNSKLMVDHINHNTLDNRKHNLRLVSNKQNQQNRKSVRGCSWNKHAKKWHALLRVDGRNIHVGYFDTIEAAQQAYLKAREEYGYIDSPVQQLAIPKINIIKQEARIVC